MSLLADDILDVLAMVIDPELGMNIIDLGLVYDVQAQAAAMSITMTMTTPACPIASHLVDQTKAAVHSQFPTLQTIDIQLVWEPAWHPLMMSWKARERLGWT
jgi:metal-sulfur cluster biosynthetic enzyme